MTTDQHSSTAPLPGQGANGPGVAGVERGLLGLGMVFVVPLGGLFLGVLGIVLSAVGVSQGRRTGRSTGLAVVGVVLGLLAEVLAILFLGAVVSAPD